MSNNRDYTKQVWNEGTFLKTHRRGWDVGNCVPMTVDGYRGYYLQTSQPSQQRSALEVNFFSTELMSVSPLDEKELMLFMGTYGLLDCPKRYFGASFESALGASIPFGGTDAARMSLEKDNLKYFKSVGSSKSAASIHKPSHFVTCEEATAVLTALQNTVYGLASVLENKALQNPMLFDFVNLTASNEVQISYAIRQDAEYDKGICFEETPNIGSLVSAVSNQIIETVADAAPWYRCKDRDCERWFKRKRGTDNPRTNSEYCCQKCSERNRKREQRNQKRMQSQPADTSTQ